MFKVLHDIKQNERCCTVAFDNNKEYFAFSEKNYVKIYNNYEINSFECDLDPSFKIKSNEDIIHAKFNPLGDKFVISDFDNKINVFDSDKGFNQLGCIEPGTLKTWKFEFDPNNREIVTGCYSIMFYDLDSMVKTLEISNDLKYFYSLCFINTDIFAVGNSNGSIYIYSKEEKKKKHKMEDNCLAIRAMAYDGVNKRLLAASDDLHINIIDVEKFNVIIPMVGHKDNISALAVNSEQGIYASASNDGTIKIWDIKQPKCIQTIDLNTSSNIDSLNDSNIIWDIAFSNTGKELICGSDSGCYILTLA